MNVRGRRIVDAPREAVFAAILDPATLLAVIPGCREIERIGDEYRGRISLRLPGMVGSYRTTVRVTESDPPRSGRLDGEVAGALGTIAGRASFRLADDDGRTVVDYEGEAAIGGALARLDNRFVEGLASSLIDRGLADLERQLHDGGVRAARPGNAASPATAPGNRASPLAAPGGREHTTAGHHR